MPQPPRSTLFPYTTLFRSKMLTVPPAVEEAPTLRFDRSSLSNLRDRKSTRLNSSHEWISYAVFCLKKKLSVTETRDPVTKTRLNVAIRDDTVAMPRHGQA